MLSSFVMLRLRETSNQPPKHAEDKPGARAGRKAGTEKGDLASAAQGVMVSVIQGSCLQGPLCVLESIAANRG